MYSLPFQQEIKEDTKPAEQTILTAKDIENGRFGCCNVCTLSKISHKINTRGKGNNPKVLIFGEAPGKEEAEQLKPFVGGSGKIIDFTLELLERSGCITGIDYIIDNVVRCRPPENRTPTNYEQECCYTFTKQIISDVRPNVIITFGMSPTNYMFNLSGNRTFTTTMGAIRGRRFLSNIKLDNDYHYFWLFPITHPSFLLRKGINVNTLSRGNDYKGDYVAFKNDLENALKAVTLPIHNYFNFHLTYKNSIVFCNTIGEFINASLDLGSTISLDFETTTARTFSGNEKVLYTAISNYEKTVVLSFTDGNYKDKLKALKQVCLHKCIIVHSLNMEMEWFLFLFGFDFIKNVKLLDTRVCEYILHGSREKEATQNLNLLALQYLSVAIKNKTNVSAKNLSRTSEYDNMLYNGVDAKTTFALYALQKSEIVVKNLSFVEGMKICDTMSGVIMSYQGVKPYQPTLLKKKEEYTQRLNDVYNSFKTNEQVLEYKKRLGIFPNLSSNKDLLNLFTLAGLGDIIKDKFGKVKTGKDVIDFIVSLYESGKIDNKLSDFVKILAKYRECTKMLNTYIEPFLLDNEQTLLVNEMLHTEFSSTNVVTGRFSSSRPNLQNLPIRHDKEYRGIIVAGDGKSIIALDLGQIEARIIALTLKAIMNDDVFIQYLWEGKDIHGDVTEIFIKHFPEAYYTSLLKENNNDKDKAFKAYRKIMKNTFTFPYLYLAGKNKLATLNRVTEEQIEVIIEMFNKKFPAVKQWHKYLFDFINIHGYLETLTGVRIYAPLEYNQVANLTIQHTAVQLLNDVLYRLIFNKGIDCRIQVHDEIVIFVDDDKIFEVVDIIKNEIWTITKYPKNWHWWLKLAPLTFTVSIGKTYSSLETIGEFSTIEGNWNIN